MFHLRINFFFVKIPNISTTKRVVDFLQEYLNYKMNVDSIVFVNSL